MILEKREKNEEKRKGNWMIQRASRSANPRLMLIGRAFEPARGENLLFYGKIPKKFFPTPLHKFKKLVYYCFLCFVGVFV